MRRENKGRKTALSDKEKGKSEKAKVGQRAEDRGQRTDDSRYRKSWRSLRLRARTGPAAADGRPGVDCAKQSQKAVGGKREAVRGKRWAVSN